MMFVRKQKKRKVIWAARIASHNLYQYDADSLAGRHAQMQVEVRQRHRPGMSCNTAKRKMTCTDVQFMQSVVSPVPHRARTILHQNEHT